MAEVVADICRDLGLGTLLGNHPWKRRGPADVAALCARAGQAPGEARAAQSDAEPSPAATWAGPPPFSQEASIELMHKLLEFRPPRIRGP